VVAVVVVVVVLLAVAVVVVVVVEVVPEEPRAVIGSLSSPTDMVVSSLPTERRTCWLPKT